MDGISEKLQRRLLIGPHYAMERFAVLCGIGLAMFVALGILFGAHQVRRHSADFASRTIYQSSFVTSVSGAEGTVRGVFTNENQTKAAVLMKFTDPASMPNDADNYRMLMYAQDESGASEKLESRPTGNVYVYGSSGYIVFTFDNGDAPFPCQIIHGFARNNRPLSGMVDTSSNATLATANDIWDVLFNPGASGVTKISAFDDGKFDPVRFYNEVLVRGEENSIRQNLANDLKSLQTVITYSEEYMDRLERDGLNVSEQIPDFYAGDSITVGEDGALTLVTSTVVPGGFDFDWKSGSVATGYLNNLMVGSDAASPSEFLSARIASQSKFTFVPGEWHMADGQLFEDVAKVNASARMDDIRSDITNLETMWETYAVIKSAYQTTDINPLLQLEIDSQSVASNYTVSENALVYAD